MKVRIVWSGPKAAFVCPILFGGRTAVLCRGFKDGKNVRVFPRGWCEEAADFQPAAVAGGKAQLLELLHVKPESLNRALVAVLRPGDRFLTEAERDRFWRTLGVPLFEQIMDRSGKLLAAECEAHEGLHVAVPEEELKLDMTEFQFDRSACGCGRKTPRLIPSGREDLLSLAASAR